MQVFIIQTRDTRYTYNWSNISAYFDEDVVKQKIKKLRKVYINGVEYQIDTLTVIDAKKFIEGT